MFYSKNSKDKIGTKGLDDFLEDIYMGEDRFDLHREKIEDDSSKDKLNHILKSYDIHEEYVKDLVKDFASSQAHSVGLEDQILELFNNVKNLLISGDKDLIRHCIKSISIGRENALRFIEDQKGYIDETTLNIMNAIVSEYSHHINYLNEAISILEE